MMTPNRVLENRVKVIGELIELVERHAQTTGQTIDQVVAVLTTTDPGLVERREQLWADLGELRKHGYNPSQETRAAFLAHLKARQLPTLAHRFTIRTTAETRSATRRQRTYIIDADDAAYAEEVATTWHLAAVGWNSTITVEILDVDSLGAPVDCPHADERRTGGLVYRADGGRDCKTLCAKPAANHCDRLANAACALGFGPADLPVNLVEFGDGRNWAKVANAAGLNFPTEGQRRNIIDLLK